MENKSNAILLIDYENTHYNFIDNYQNVFELNFFTKLKKYLNENGYEILDSIAYCNFDIKDMYNSYHQTKLHQLGIDTRHTTNNGKNYADVQITADAVELVHTNENIDCIFLISNDKDMTPLIKAVKKTNVAINLVLFKDNYDNVLLEYPNAHFFIEDILDIELEQSKVTKIKEDICDNLVKYMDSKNPPGATTPFLYSIEKFMESSVSWFKLFEYEVIRNLSELEKENKIFVYTYQMNGSGKEYIGISITKHEQLYITSGVKHKVTKVSNYISQQVIQSYYDKYNKKD